MDKSTQDFLKAMGIEKGSVKEIETQWKKWDFQTDQRFIGMCIGQEQILEMDDGVKLTIVGFENVFSGETVGILKSHKISEMMERGDLVAMNWYLIEHKGKKDLKGGRTVNLYDVYELPEDSIEKIRENPPF